MTLCALAWYLALTAAPFSAVAPFPADRPALEAAADSAGIPRILFVAIAQVETPGPGNHWIGARGEIGRLQVRPGLWRGFNAHCRRLESYPDNLACGAWILRYHYDRLGSWSLAVRAYNGSIRAPATARYLAKVEREIGRLTLRSVDDGSLGR